jgi:hypothetical protein
MSFYSGGVDSIFNIAGRRADKLSEIDYLVAVWGMDIKLENEALWNTTKTMLIDAIPNESASTFLPVKTNSRDFQRDVRWTDMGFGPMLGAITNFLSKGARFSIIGSYGLYDDLQPHASGPLVDRLYSSSHISVVHYSPRFNRFNKVKYISEYAPEYLKNLRVCWLNTGNKYNCGECEKCLRTKMDIHILGLNDSVVSFGKFDMEKDARKVIGQIPGSNSYTLEFWKNRLRLCKEKSIRRILAVAVLRGTLARQWHLCKQLIKVVVRHK